MCLTDKAMLARLSITQWSARKLDKRVTEEVRINHGAAADAGRYNKALVSAEALKMISQAATAGREVHYTYTLPWADDGQRILPAAAYLQYMNKMRELRDSFDSAVRSFCADYPQYVAQARGRLNGMFAESDYPAVSDIASRFTWEVQVQALPLGEDFRVKLSDEETAVIKADIDRRTREALQTGLRDAWARLHDALSRVVERLSDPDAIFRDSLIGNLHDLCSVLPLLNFADDPHLETARKAVENRLAGLHPDELRNNLKLRAQAAADAKSIMADMGAFMGAGGGS